MGKIKLVAALTACVLAFSLLTPAARGSITEDDTVSNWDTGRYGDRIDIDGTLDQQSKDISFLERTEKEIRRKADEIDPKQEGSSADDSNFTYDGGTKYYLNYELSFKEFTLRSVGENIEIWVANDLEFPAGDVRPAPVVTQEQVDKLRDEFDANIYPKATSFFGTPGNLDGSNSPLVDWGYFPEGYYEGSNKAIILVDNIIDEQYYDPTYPFFVAGFFWQTIEDYIDRNIITIDTKDWATRLENTYFGTTIHELQHLIHSDNDGAEESWINEGMSTFSEFLGGYGHDAGSINFFLDHPENSLVSWDEHYSAETGPETIADYGQAYLFTLYMNDKLGMEFIRSLALSRKQGIDSINEVLAEHHSRLDFTELYQNFITALVLDSSMGENGIYGFDSIDLRKLPIDASGTERGMTVDFEKALTYEKEGVPAWGGDFKGLDFNEKIRSISFNGIDFLPVRWESVEDPLGSGNQVLWGNEGDEADNVIIFEADLTNTDQATLLFDNYIDIEEQWDFGFVQISADGGNTWSSLVNENVRSDVADQGYPKIKENIPGFTGYYNDWRKETFDLSAYAGQKIFISFRYITDWAYNDKGWFIDNIEIPEIGFINDGSSTDAFISLNRLLGQYVDYTVIFINERIVGKGNGQRINYNVVTVDPFNVTEENAIMLKQLFQDGNNYMITTYAAAAGDRNPVEFSYEVKLKVKGPVKE